MNGEPYLLLKQGNFIPAALKQARVTEDEIRSAIRAEGMSDLEMVEAVVRQTVQ